MSARPDDPVARRLLAELIRLEAAAWPAGREAYASQLVALAVRCELAAAKAEVHRWFLRESGAVLIVYGAARRERLRDAFHDAIVRLPGLLLRFRAGLVADRRPNLRSMLACWIRWRARDALRGWQRTSRLPPNELVAPDAVPSTADFAVQLREVLALIAGDDPRHRALRLVGLGYSVAEAARVTGASRQQIYRARELLLAAWGPPAGDTG